ncbi:ABC-type multidrug transport system, ATPase and permease component [Aequorivita sublithincola DSM 14238]|uniref:ABC-type multidrug transport system, ATPase and permease component n=1 Tax=Aequorivita sublithincola (strain DSM 14238 / LMG 21431 / ACAM 643 / 9-3) TaxID=746697 RepID=I3YS69_AEQSU|nr:ABC transporter ATP-binding protein [Aequorivita sublithincola]AFL79837.1 ABC-type multidrug transport system, ATPase and permease component [Aequorivita sublithincola DSM 14238]
MKELKYLNKYFLKYKGRLLLGVFITIIATAFKLVVPMKVGDSVTAVKQYLNGQITDIAIVKHELLINILLLLGAALLSALFTFMMRQTFIVVSRYVEYDLKNEIFQHYEKLSLGFYKQNRTGDLMNRISEDVSKVRMYVGPALMYSITTVTLFIVVVSYMFYKAPTLTLYAIAPLPILSLAIYKLSVLINQRTTIVQQYLSKLTTFTQESFSGIAVIKAYGIEPRTNANFEELAEGSKVKNIDLAKVQALFFPLMMLLIGVSNILVIYIGGTRYISGEIAEFGTIVEFLIYVNMLTWPVAVVGWVTSMVQQAEASQKRINEFLKTEPSIQNLVEVSTPVQGNIEFNNLTFTYPDTGITALKDVSFTVKPGETLAIVGNTGSGKSTILELIGRLYDVEEGMLTIDETPIRNLNLEDLRHSIGYVPQDAFLFSDSLRNNIRFGKEDASEEEVIEAAKNAAVHKNIIGFTNGYDTILGERGITLSGGQKQRVSIARAIIKDPKILLFDDCLSAVDTETEEEILQNLSKISKEKTTIIVSHRISSAKNATKIIVLNEGKIIQQGSHNELVNAEGYYKELYAKQLLEKEM